MSAVKQEIKKYTVEEYFDLERDAQYKSEYYDGEIWAMAGTSIPHSQIVVNIGGECRTRLPKGCQPLSSDTQVRIEKWNVNTYPDLSIVCGEIEQYNTIAIKNPKVLVEVLSDSTANFDRTTKFKYYRSLPSLKEYVLIEQKQASIQTYVKEVSPEGEVRWVSYFFDGLDEILILKSLDIQIPLKEIYKNVNFEEQEKQV